MDSRLTLDYLRLVFGPETAPIAQGRWRLLVIDGFDCHLDYQVIEYCWQHCILPFTLPLHMIHVLQPLDVAVFSSLSNAYSKEVNYIRAAVDQDIFPNIFFYAQQAAFSPSNIRSGFGKTGIWPFDPEQRLQNIRHPQLLSYTPSYSLPSSPQLSFTHTSPPPPNFPSSNIFCSPKTPTTPRSLKTLFAKARSNLASNSPKSQQTSSLLRKLYQSAECGITEAQLARVGEEHLLNEIQLLQNKGKGDKRQLKKEKNKGYLVVPGSVLAKKREELDEEDEKKARQPNQKKRKYKKRMSKSQVLSCYPLLLSFSLLFFFFSFKNSIIHNSYFCWASPFLL